MLELCHANSKTLKCIFRFRSILVCNFRPKNKVICFDPYLESSKVAKHVHRLLLILFSFRWLAYKIKWLQIRKSWSLRQFFSWLGHGVWWLLGYEWCQRGLSSTGIYQVNWDIPEQLRHLSRHITGKAMEPYGLTTFNVLVMSRIYGIVPTLAGVRTIVFTMKMQALTVPNN